MPAPSVTPEQVQVQLGTDVGSPKILRAEQTLAPTVAGYLVCGQVVVPGRTRWCTTTNTDTAAQQATAILAALRA